MLGVHHADGTSHRLEALSGQCQFALTAPCSTPSGECVWPVHLRAAPEATPSSDATSRGKSPEQLLLAEPRGLNISEFLKIFKVQAPRG